MLSFVDSLSLVISPPMQLSAHGQVYIAGRAQDAVQNSATLACFSLVLRQLRCQGNENYFIDGWRANHQTCQGGRGAHVQCWKAVTPGPATVVWTLPRLRCCHATVRRCKSGEKLQAENAAPSSLAQRGSQKSALGLWRSHINSLRVKPCLDTSPYHHGRTYGLMQPRSGKRKQRHGRKLQAHLWRHAARACANFVICSLCGSIARSRVFELRDLDLMRRNPDCDDQQHGVDKRGVERRRTSERRGNAYWHRRLARRRLDTMLIWSVKCRSGCRLRLDSAAGWGCVCWLRWAAVHGLHASCALGVGMRRARRSRRVRADDSRCSAIRRRASAARLLTGARRRLLIVPVCRSLRRLRLGSRSAARRPCGGQRGRRRLSSGGRLLSPRSLAVTGGPVAVQLGRLLPLHPA